MATRPRAAPILADFARQSAPANTSAGHPGAPLPSLNQRLYPSGQTRAT